MTGLTFGGRRFALRWRVACALAGLALAASWTPIGGPSARSAPDRLLAPLGGGDAGPGLWTSIAARAAGTAVKAVLLPLGAAPDPYAVAPEERARLLAEADLQRDGLEGACRAEVEASMRCVVVVAPILTRGDAYDRLATAEFTADLDAVFLAEGDPAAAMQVVAATPLEEALADAYGRGVVIVGNGAGAAPLSRAMMAGYRPGFGAGSALQLGAAEVWHDGLRRGLDTGLVDAVIDGRFFEQGNMGRLLNALAQPGVPGVGIGVDADTGVLVGGGRRVGPAFGTYATAVLDVATFDSVVPPGPGPERVVRLRNVLVHLLAPGDATFDLATRESTMGAPPERLQRQFEALRVPPGAGVLLLSGDLGTSLLTDPVLERLVDHAGGPGAQVLVIATGYDGEDRAAAAANRFVAALAGRGVVGRATTVAHDDIEAPKVPDDVTGIVLVGEDPTLIEPRLLESVDKAWRLGTPLLADNAAAAVVGPVFTNHGPTPADPELRERFTQGTLLAGQTLFAPGLAIVPHTVEPRVLEGLRWGRLLSMAHAHPERLALGLTRDTAIEIGPQSARVVGANGLFVLDLGAATLGAGTNDALLIGNGLLDVFGNGETVAAAPAARQLPGRRALLPMVSR